MEDVRRSVDSKSLANRGKMLPAGEAESLAHVGPHPLEKAGVIFRE
jgi:glycolate oxidase